MLTFFVRHDVELYALGAISLCRMRSDSIKNKVLYQTTRASAATLSTKAFGAPRRREEVKMSDGTRNGN